MKCLNKARSELNFCWNLTRIFIIFIFIVIISLMPGCFTGEKEAELEKMWPLEEGNEWGYQVDGGEEEELSISVYSVEEDEEFGKTYQVEFDFGSYQTYEHYSYDDEGLLWFQMSNPWGTYNRVPPEYLIKDPPGEAKSWEWDGELETISGRDLHYKGEGKIDQKGFMELELPDGSYNALKVEKNLTLEMDGETVELQDVRYYVPEIGLVKQEVHENGYEQLNIVIDDYELN
ncbi:hypothetical protein [Natranaerofaba carboxydovora]|uniref:hypothetical protein n=1 Tax=Natranaerofaba carboxydovora TaxID=2742683 RepID=UPI001F1450D8|nr:hypothetical protein [Natranaerofaba carboxydovora]UMZ75020.1 hypothetical protein ACONDI_02628 [Natranaerofaba carboxydovora]